MVTRWLPITVGQDLSLDEAAQKGREYIEWTDQQAKDVHFPGVAEIVYLQGVLFDIADEIGVGNEVRAVVYSLRSVSYFGVAANALGFGPYGPAMGAAAVGAGLVTSLGAFGALAAGGALALVGSLIGGLFGDDSDDEKAKRKKRRERIEKDLRDLLKPATLSTLAADQDRVAVAWTPGQFGPPTPDQAARKATAVKLAAFFRAARLKLTAAERQLFEGLINIGRWGNALAIYSNMSPSARSNLSTLAYEGGWKYSGPSPLSGDLVPVSPIVDYGARLQARLEAALSDLGKRRWNGPSTGLATKLLLLAVAGAGAVKFAPRQTAAVVGAAKNAGGRVVGAARRILP